MIFLEKIKKENNKCFTTMEFIVAIAIIMILGGVFILNYNAKRETFELNNSVNAAIQEVRKAQTLIMAQTQKRCEGSDTTSVAQNYGVKFQVSDDDNKVFLFGDVGVSGEECKIEEKWFSKLIKISGIMINGKSTIYPDNAFVSFEKDTLEISINGISDATDIRITLCVKSNCENTAKTVVINNKGLVTVE